MREHEIIEKLAQWWRRLDESGGGVILDALRVEFGEAVDSDNEFDLTDDAFTRLFDILNETLFKGLIVKRPLLVAAGKARILEIIKNYCPDDFNCHTYSHRFVGMFFSTYDILSGGKIVGSSDSYMYDGGEDVVFSNRTIFVNMDETRGFCLMAYVNCIAHEMIHCFDEDLGDTKQRIIVSNMYGRLIDSHETATFVRKQTEANRLSLNVVDRLFESRKLYDYLPPDKLYNLSGLTPRACKMVFDDGKWYVDMRTAPDLDTDSELHITVGPHTRALIQF